jgi:hypothetical protein
MKSKALTSKVLHYQGVLCRMKQSTIAVANFFIVMLKLARVTGNAAVTDFPSTPAYGPWISTVLNNMLDMYDDA